MKTILLIIFLLCPFYSAYGQATGHGSSAIPDDLDCDNLIEKYAAYEEWCEQNKEAQAAAKIELENAADRERALIEEAEALQAQGEALLEAGDLAGTIAVWKQAKSLLDDNGIKTIDNLSVRLNIEIQRAQGVLESRRKQEPAESEQEGAAQTATADDDFWGGGEESSDETVVSADDDFWEGGSASSEEDSISESGDGGFWSGEEAVAANQDDSREADAEGSSGSGSNTVRADVEKFHVEKPHCGEYTFIRKYYGLRDKNSGEVTLEPTFITLEQVEGQPNHWVAWLDCPVGHDLDPSNQNPDNDHALIDSYGNNVLPHLYFKLSAGKFRIETGRSLNLEKYCDATDQIHGTYGDLEWVIYELDYTVRSRSIQEKVPVGHSACW